jgi:hypothetical protein
MKICVCGHGRRSHPDGDVCMFNWKNKDGGCECGGFEQRKENEK